MRRAIIEAIKLVGDVNSRPEFPSKTPDQFRDELLSRKIANETLFKARQVMPRKEVNLAIAEGVFQGRRKRI